MLVEDPFSIRNSLKFVEYSKENKPLGYMFFIDVVDLFYSIAQSQLLDAAVSYIAENGDIDFQNNAGVSLDKFIALLQLYLSSTIAPYQESFCAKNGICIGSCVAPVLCNIYLAGLDRVLSRALEEDKVLGCFR